MAVLVNFFGYEVKNFFSKKILIILAIGFLASFYVVLDGIHAYQRTVDFKKEFQEMGADAFKRTGSYAYYGAKGISIYYLPSAAEIFFPKNGGLYELSSKVDALYDLDIYNNGNSRAIFSEDSSTAFRLSNIILYIGNFLVLLWGYEVLRDKEYLKKLASLASNSKVYLSIALSRIVLIASTLFVLLVIMILVTRLNGIVFTSADYDGLLKYFLVSLIMLISSFLGGLIIGTFRKKTTALTAIVCVWFTIAFLIPGGVKHITSKSANSITSYYKNVLDKAQVIHEYEKRLEESYGEFDRKHIEKERKLIEEFWNVHYGKLEVIDEALTDEFESIIALQGAISMFTPTSFYVMTNAEISSHGYENFLSLKKYLKKIRRDFVRFWIDRVYYHDSKELVNFLETGKDLDIFKAQTLPPPQFWMGVSLNLIWIVLLVIIAYIRYSAVLLPVCKKENEKEAARKLDMELEPHSHAFLFVESEGQLRRILSVFFGKIKNFEGRITLGDKNLVTPEKKDFFYAPQPKFLPPDIKASDFISLVGGLSGKNRSERSKIREYYQLNDIWDSKIEDLEVIDRSRLLIAAAGMKKRDIYIFDQVFQDLKPEETEDAKQWLDELVRQDGSVIHINSDKYFFPESKVKRFFPRRER